MKLDVSKFCALSTNVILHRWLHINAIELYSELMMHLSSGKSCSQNKTKMLEIYKKISVNESLFDKFKEFMEEYFGYMILKSIEQLPDNNKHNVFKHYNPKLNTIPRRLILTESEAISKNVSLKELVNDFCRNHYRCEKLFIEDRCYIEFVPFELAEYANKIPPKNWQLLNR